jgi:hypothetical protein
VLPEEVDEVGGSPYAAFKAAIARAKDPSLSPDERHKAGLDVALQMMGHPCLGISTVRDRVCMTAAMLVLEPIFEADFPSEIYAYRAGRNAISTPRSP